MKFCRVVEPKLKRLAKLPKPAPVTLPTFKEVAKRLVEEAVVPKILEVVALLEVEFKAVKFCKVLDPVTKRLVEVAEVKVARPTVSNLALLSKRKLESEERV